MYGYTTRHEKEYNVVDVLAMSVRFLFQRIPSCLGILPSMKTTFQRKEP